MAIETYSAGGVVVNPEGNVLIVSQWGTSWSLPKGHIESGESFLGAALREIREESGITELEVVKILGTYNRHKIDRDGKEDTSELKYITIILFATGQEILRPIDTDNPEALWVDPDDVKQYLKGKDLEFWLSVKSQILKPKNLSGGER